MIRKVLGYLARKHSIFLKVYTKLLRVSGEEYADIVKSYGLFFSMGNKCSIIPGTYLGDAKYIRIGNNVRLASCYLLAHDGVINMLRQAYDVTLDAVGKIDIGDNVFIGQNAIVLRNCTIGNNCVIAAGAVVTNDVPANSVVGGIPAKRICSTDELVERLKCESESLPWYSIVEQRARGEGQGLKPDLARLRRQFFFGQ